MKVAALALLVVGILAVLVGLVWIGQGTGYFPYPHRSFMIDDRRWAYYGAGLAVLGVAAVAVARRLSRRSANLPHFRPNGSTKRG